MSILDKLQTINKSLKIDGGVGLKTYTAEEILALNVPEGMTAILAESTTGSLIYCTKDKKATIGNKINRYTFTVTQENINSDLYSTVYIILKYAISVKSITLAGINGREFTCNKVVENEDNTREYNFTSIEKGADGKLDILNYWVKSYVNGNSTLTTNAIIENGSYPAITTAITDPILTITYMSDRDLS